MAGQVAVVDPGEEGERYREGNGPLRTILRKLMPRPGETVTIEYVHRMTSLELALSLRLTHPVS